MGERILETLEPVRRRQFGLEIVRCSAIGLLAGSLSAVVLGILRWQGSGSVPAALGAACLGGGPLIGALIGVLRGRSVHLAAATVDRCYNLKDRAATAIDFLRRGQPTPLHVLQVADAERHLAGIDVRRVAPYRVPRVMPYALAATAVALGLLLWPQPARVHAKPSEPLETVLAAAIEAEESLEALEETAKKENDSKLKDLVQKLNETIQEMKLPGVDTKEALAKLSEMQAAISAQQAQFNVGLVDAQMQALGEAMASTQALEGAGKALQQRKYDQAAEKLEKAEPKFDRKEAKTLKDKLAQAAKSMDDAGLAELSTATTELSESMEDAATAASALKKLGNLARSQSRRKKINDLLALQNRKLSECKGNCQKNSTAKLQASAEVYQADEQLGHVHQRQHRRRDDQARLGPSEGAGEGRDGRRRLRDRDDAHARRPSGSRASVSRAVSEISPYDRSRAGFRADSARSTTNHSPLFRADSPPG